MDWGSNSALIRYNIGDGSDLIEGFNATSTLQIGDGNDIIQGFNSTSTLQLGDGTDTFSKTISGGDIIITTGDGQITLAGAATLSPLYVRGVEEIKGESKSNDKNNVVINGTQGNDTINNSGQNVTISGKGGRDYIVNNSHNVSISGGAGDDSIINENITVSSEDDSTTLNGDDGNDYIENKVDFVEIAGGAGNDSITNSGSNVLFNYTFGEGSDIIYGFNSTSTLNIAGAEFTSAKSGKDIVITIGGGNVTLKDAANLDTVNVVHAKVENPLNTVNEKDKTLIVGTSLSDTISNRGENVTIQAQAGNDSIYNSSSKVTLSGGAGNDSIVNDYGMLSSISGDAGNDLITVTSGNKITVNAGKGSDQIYLHNNVAILLEYTAGDGNNYIQGFNEATTLNIAKSEFTSASTSSGDVIVTVGADKITLDGAAKLSTIHIVNGSYVNFAIKDSKVTYDTDFPESVIKAAYQFNKDSALFKLDSSLKYYSVTIENDEKNSVKVDWDFGKVTLNSASVLEYELDKKKKPNVTLTIKNYGDKITFDEAANFTYGDIEVELLEGSAISTKSEQGISFDNNSSAIVTAYEGSQIEIGASKLTVNELPIISEVGAGTITVTDDGMTFEGYGVQFADLEVANESYFGNLKPMTVTYNSDEGNYTIQNTACVKTLANDFTKLTFDISDAENYAYYQVNDKEILIANVADNINVIEADGSLFKIQDKEVETENIGRITIDEQITFSGMEINFDDVKVNYALNKPVSYSLDGEEITISDAATIVTRNEERGTRNKEQVVTDSNEE